MSPRRGTDPAAEAAAERLRQADARKQAAHEQALQDERNRQAALEAVRRHGQDPGQ